jgi:hypothetical protein
MKPDSQEPDLESASQPSLLSEVTIPVWLGNLLVLTLVTVRRVVVIPYVVVGLVLGLCLRLLFKDDRLLKYFLDFEV